MIDEVETIEGDVVHDGNIAQWQQKFCDDTGHSMTCVNQSVNDMAELTAKVCTAFNGVPVDELVEQIGVEEFDKHIRAILKTKDCNCND